jgi:hypothetical protein
MKEIGACHSHSDTGLWLEMTFATNQPAFDRPADVCILVPGAARRCGPDVSPVWTGDREAAMGRVGPPGKSVRPTVQSIVWHERTGIKRRRVTFSTR